MIRYYESIGLIEPPIRTQAGYRVYTAEEIHELRFIKRARTLGFSIEEARELLALWRDKSRASADVKTFAMKHVRDLETKIDELQAMSRTLRHLAQTCHGDDRPECPILADLALPDARQPPAEKKRGKAKTHADCTCDEGDTFSSRH
jgi:Cu(I)-responsive transcriptional regulator